MKKFRPFTIVFALVFIVQLFAEYEGQKILIYISKPLITIVLAAGLINVTQLAGKFKKRIFGGLIFALFGDVLLMLQGDYPSFFMYGLISFLICHILYISAFQLDIKSDPSKISGRYFFWVGFILAVFCGAFYMYLRPNLGGLAVPVMIYSIVLSLMVMFALYRIKRVNYQSFMMIAIGALLFLLSDSSLAYNKFMIPIPNSGLLIMGTYMLAQYFITLGAVERVLVVKLTEEK